MFKNVIEWFLILTVFGLSAIVGNWVGYDVLPTAAIPGMLVLILISVLGLVLEKVVPGNIPSVGYIGIIGIIISIPGFPGSEYVVRWTSEINILALATPILAYAGISIGKNWADFSKLGWRSVIVAIFVFFGTFIGSAVIAEIILRMQGII
ncbi:hypothetical protein J7I93_04355 [Bacillus sp. ISL-47]|uniref:hypothetical protein n=1 Tax=Bacillus sp. ISL-47 TaxID=2819130 RepID=UPI001BE79047|nr:hypothetical protein [Bacillus sp. ISL-47]MBT2687410.1 hypothetical protein [Bacillus sp. ISL-47]MBT2707128.1 hypothetical protein [Pseudomonas sp. ISL-84]